MMAALRAVSTADQTADKLAALWDEKRAAR